MKTVTVRKTFQNEGETVRAARPGQPPVKITVSDTRARDLLKSGLVSDEEDAPEPTEEELRELAMKATRHMIVEAGDSHIVVIRTKNAAQGDALRWMLRAVKGEAADHGHDDEDESTGSAAGVTFSRERRNPRPMTSESGGGATGADVQQPAGDEPDQDPPADDPPADNPPATDPPAEDPPATDPPHVDPVTTETAGAVTPRRPRGNRTGEAAT